MTRQHLHNQIRDNKVDISEIDADMLADLGAFYSPDIEVWLAVKEEQGKRSMAKVTKIREDFFDKKG